MKLVVLDGEAFNPGDISWDEFRVLGEFEYYPRSTAEEVIERGRDAEVIFTNKCVIDKKVIDSLKNLKYVGEFATGYNNIDINYAKEKGIVVTNVPNYSTDSVAQTTFALLLEITTKVGMHDKSVKDGDWCKCPNFCYWLDSLTELKDKKIGIVGYGNIGKKVAEISKAFGMQVFVNSRSYRGEGYLDLEEMYKICDIITLHLPLTEQNKEMINRESINKMKDGVIIVNTARGGLVNEEDMKNALNSGKVKAFACDVISEEPMKKDNPLLKAKNVIITPHIAWVSYETRKRLYDIALNNVKGWLSGNVENQVNR